MTKEQAYQCFIANMVGWLPQGTILHRYAVKLIDDDDPAGLYDCMMSEYEDARGLASANRDTGSEGE